MTIAERLEPKPDSMTPYQHTLARRVASLEARSRRGVLFIRLPPCEVCGAPRSERPNPAIRFVESHPRWAAI